MTVCQVKQKIADITCPSPTLTKLGSMYNLRSKKPFYNGQNSRSLGQDFNPEPPEYEAGELTLDHNVG
jgi:hypothetical protein